MAETNEPLPWPWKLDIVTIEEGFKKELNDFTSLPPAEMVRLIDWQEGEVNPGFINDTYFLTVRGEQRWLSMEVSLHPLAYVTRPEFWLIHVVGHLSGIGLPTTKPYEVTNELTPSSGLGTKGVVLVGAKTSSVNILIPPDRQIFHPK